MGAACHEDVRALKKRLGCLANPDRGEVLLFFYPAQGPGRTVFWAGMGVGIGCLEDWWL